MTSPALPAFSPVLAEHRLDALDVVRGFALVGICIANVEFFNRPVAESGDGIPAGLHGLDWLVAFMVNYLVSGKFWTIFSLLFGMGFALMLERAQSAGRSFLPTYWRRIAVLGAFGLLHYLLLWSGDILISYACGALVLMLILFGRPGWMIPALLACFVLAQVPGFAVAGWGVLPIVFAGTVGAYLRSEKRALFALLTIVPGSLMLLSAALGAVSGKDGGSLVLPAFGAGLVALGLLAWRFGAAPLLRPLHAGVAIFMLVYALAALDGGMRLASSAPDPSSGLTSTEYLAERAARSAQEKQVLTNGSYADAIAMRWQHLDNRIEEESGSVVIVASMFLIGVWFVRAGVIANAAAHLPLLRGLAVGGIVGGIGLGLAGSAFSTGRMPGVDDPAYDLAFALLTLGSLPASLGYVAALLLALHAGGALARIKLLAPYGRMALSNYLMQSLVFSLLFYPYSLGLWGMGRTGQVGIAVLLCALQIGFSHWWMARFQYGPAEWLWRALTYLAWPPMRRVDR